MFSPVFKDIYIYNLQSRNCVVDVFFKVSVCVCACVCTRGILTLILQPSQLVFYFSPEQFHWLSVEAVWGRWNNLLSWMPHFALTRGNSVPVEGWVVGAEVGQHWATQTSIQLPTKHPCRSRFGLALTMQFYLNLQKPWGNFHLITRSMGVRLILHAYFCFPKHSCWEAIQIGGIWCIFPQEPDLFLMD